MVLEENKKKNAAKQEEADRENFSRVPQSEYFGIGSSYLHIFPFFSLGFRWKKRISISISLMKIPSSVIYRPSQPPKTKIAGASRQVSSANELVASWFMLERAESVGCGSARMRFQLLITFDTKELQAWISFMRNFFLLFSQLKIFLEHQKRPTRLLLASTSPIMIEVFNRSSAIASITNLISLGSKRANFRLIKANSSWIEWNTRLVWVIWSKSRS